ncbi:MAG: 4Fe-4S binding protein [Promethearchaeota archaeon]
MSREYFRPIQINPTLCKGCARCLRACPNKAISFKGNQRLIDYKKCKGCLTCVNVCPNNAITVTSVEKGEVVSVENIFEQCTNCGACAEICPHQLWVPHKYKMKNGELKDVYWVDPQNYYKCEGCELCVNNCPENIITIQRFNPKNS